MTGERRGIPLRPHATVTELTDDRWRFTVPWSSHVVDITAEDLNTAHRLFGLHYMQVLQADPTERDALAAYLKEHGV